MYEVHVIVSPRDFLLLEDVREFAATFVNTNGVGKYKCEKMHALYLFLMSKKIFLLYWLLESKNNSFTPISQLRSYWRYIDICIKTILDILLPS